MAYVGVGVSLLLVPFGLFHTHLTLTLAIQTLVHQLMWLRTHVRLRAMFGWRRACLCVRAGDCVEMVLLNPLRKWVVSLYWGVWFNGSMWDLHHVTCYVSMLENVQNFAAKIATGHSTVSHEHCAK